MRELEGIEKTAQPLIDGLSMPQSQQGIEQISQENLVVGTLFHCLCEACPIKDHQKHTVYFSLISRSSDTLQTQLAIRSRVKKDKCLIWLQAVWEKLYEESEPTGPDTIKRKRPFSDETLPEPKRFRVSNNNYSDRHNVFEMPIAPKHVTTHIQMCPEHLSQHGEPNLLAMQIVAMSTVRHRIYFLPADKRPVNERSPFTLADLLDNHDNTQIVKMCTHHGNAFLWRVHVARLIAEAVLRYDCPESTCRWGKDDVIFYTSRAPNGNLEPYLKIDIERYAHGVSSVDGTLGNSEKKWKLLLLNVAFLLLQLGVFQRLQEYTRPDVGEWHRTHILQLIDEKDVGKFGDYFEIVRHCARLDPIMEGNVVSQDFRNHYYQQIVFPLQEMERRLVWIVGRRNVRRNT